MKDTASVSATTVTPPFAVEPTVASGIFAHQLVARWASISPDSIAVRGTAGAITWQQLEQRSNQLARHLLSLGATAEVPVALYFERSPEFVIAALAVWKAGGAYVPLDPSYPPERIDAILKDAAVPVLLSHKWMAAGLRSGTWSVLDLDVDASRIRSYSTEPLYQSTSGDQLAYLIYTSGSTGTPKGVEVTHANLAHLIGWHSHAFQVTSNDRASQVAGLAFDAAVWEIWCHLAAGASICLIDEESRRSPEGLRDWLVREKITISFAPTILAEHLLMLDWPVETNLRILLTGADTLHRYPRPGLPFTLVNNYGPTECTVLVTSGSVPEGTFEHIPTIGRPIDGTEILILDSALQPVPDGEAGEICAAGFQVARGYRNAPELTAEKFVSMKSALGGRIYRTGDRGRILPNGEIAFLGRIDDQIKIRGFRVEPDDIVAHLVAHPSIRNAVVSARGSSSDEKHLLAYLVLTPEVTLSAEEVRAFLAARVPDYMIPATFVRLESLPLTSTGKCDRQALPLPSAANTLRDESVMQAPATNQTEEKIREFVSALMGGRAVSRDDNFFLVGGHSMLAAQLLARVRESFGVSLTLRQLFEAPNAATLAALVDQRLARAGT